MIRLNGVNLLITKFPNQESMIVTKDGTGNKRLMIREHNEVSLRFETNEDLIYLMFLKKHIDEKKLKSYNVLKLDYMPYSRMDRSEGEVIFTLKYICEFINSLNFDKVVILEGHSNVCIALLDRVENKNYSVNLANKCMKEVGFNKKEDYIIFPDAGSQKRYEHEFKDCNFLTCNKKRDFTSGKIQSLEINEIIEKRCFKAIIVDDLVSFGRTFVMASHALAKIGAKEIYLCVTHAEEGLFLGDIFKEELINKVYTTDSILDLNRVHDNINAIIPPKRFNIEKL